MADERRTQTQTSSRSNPSTRSSEHADRRSSKRGWHGDPEGHAAAGRKGGQTVSQNRQHMADIGRKGGEAVSQNRQHMAEIGRKGGQSRGERSASNGKNQDNNT